MKTSTFPLDSKSRFRRWIAALTVFGTILAVDGATLTHDVQIDLTEITGHIVNIDNVEYMKFEPKEYNLSGEVGHPELPVKYIRLAVPTYAGNFRVSTDSQPMAVQTVSNVVYPVQQPVTTNFDGTADFTAPDEAFYNTDEWNNVVSYVGNGFLEGDQQIVTVAVYPVTYNPAINQMAIYSEVKINLKYEILAAEQMPLKPIRLKSNAHITDIRNIVDNPKFAYQIYGSYAKESGINPQIVEDYYILSPRNLVNSFDRFIKWKTAKGYHVKIVAYEDIISNSKYSSGDSLSAINDDASKVRAYLRDEFQSKKTFYVLLVGNSTNSPVFRVKTQSKVDEKDKDGNPVEDNTHLTPTDVYFYDLTTEWKTNKVGEYNFNGIDWDHGSNIDFYPELYVGRIMCTEEQHVVNYTEKLINYELNPGNGDSSYLNRSFFTQESDQKDSAVQVAGIQKQIGIFSEQTLIKDENEYKAVYDYLPLYPKGADVIKAMQKRFGYYSWHGHGSPDKIDVCKIKWITTDSIGNESTHKTAFSMFSLDSITFWPNIGFGEAGIDCMKNEGYPAIAYSISCDTTPYDKLVSKGKKCESLNMGESFTTNGRYGGPAYLGNTRIGYIGVSGKFEQAFCKQIPMTKHIGPAEIYSKIDYSPNNNDNMHLKLTHNLVGEPEFMVRTCAAKNYSDLYIETGRNNIRISSPDLDNAKLVLYDGVDNIYHLYTNGSNINYDSSVNNPVFSVWKQDFLPILMWNPVDETIVDCNKKILVNTASIGGHTGKNNPYIIGKNANVEVEAFDAVQLNDELKITDKGQLYIKAEGTVTAEGATVGKGGKLTITTNEFIMNHGFSIEKGGILETHSKSAGK